jgi:opacity protein-like surface antigen
LADLRLKRMIWLLMAALLLATPVNASAELFAVPFMGVKFGGSTSIFDPEFAAGKTTFTVGGAIMDIDDGLLGYEASFGYVLGYFEGSDRENVPFVAPGSFVIDGTASAIFLVPPRLTGYGLRPYAQIGAGLVHTQVVDNILHVFQVRRTMPVVTVGAGAVGLFTNNVGVRFDVRYLRSLTTDDGSLRTVGRRISFSRFTVGLFLRL